MLSCDFRRFLAVGLVLATTCITMPVSAADFSTSRPVIGSVSAVGAVYLRGLGISQEGTLFAGDSIRAYEKGYAKILLATGTKLELQEKTDVSLNRDAQGVKIAMNTGTLGFTAHAPLRIDVLPFEVTASDDASGNVAIMNSTAAGVRALNGKVTVRNLKTSESFVILKGQERLLGLKDGIHAPSLAELASNVPGPIPAPTPAPAPAPQTPAGTTGGGLQMDTGAWLAVIGGAAISGIAIWGLVEARKSRSDISDLKTSINNLNTTIAANNAATQAALKNLSNAAAVSNTTAQQQAQLAIIASLAGQAQLALTASGNASAAATAANLASQAAASQTRLNTLQTQISALQAQLASGSGSQQQLQTLLQQEETERANSNSLANQLNTLLNSNGSTPGIPTGRVGSVGGPTIASASVPV